MDGYLEPFKGALQSRFAKAQKWIKTIDETEGGLENFSRVSSICCSNGSQTDHVRRASRSMASMSRPTATSCTASGRPTPCEHTSLATSTTGTAMRRP
jgi:hypothetical protein